MRLRRSPLRFLASFSLLFSAFFAMATGHVFTAQAAPGPVGFGGSVGSYAVSNVAYSFDSADPTRFGGVSFDLNAPARSVQATIGGATATCSVSGTHADCAFSQPPPIASASSLQVAALS